MSIVAGVTVERLQNMIDGTPRILRLLPNTPAMVFEGAFALCSDNDLTEDELEAAKSIYSTIGVVEMIPEHLLDAACGLSGGGPAYVAMFIEAMADEAVAAGMPRKQAYEFAAQSVLGSARMVLETGRHPGELKDAVCSPGGSTIQGVRLLEERAFRGAVTDAVLAAYEKTKELGK